MEQLLDALPQMYLWADVRTYEIFLSRYFLTRYFPEARALNAEMREGQVPFTSRAMHVVVKTAVKARRSRTRPTACSYGPWVLTRPLRCSQMT